MTDFVHLRLHTEYSLVDSVVRIPELITQVAAERMPAVAVTDQNNLFALVKFYKAALEKGVKPIVGVDLLIAEPGDRVAPTRIALLCQNEAGYRNLTRLVSRAYLEGQQRGAPRIDRSWLDARSTAGLIALSCGLDGDVGRALAAGKTADARRQLAEWRALFGDRYYLEVSRVGREGEETLLAATVELALAASVPIVATNDVRFLSSADFEAHEARVCIHEGTQLGDPSRPRRYTPQQYLRSPAEMAELFADLPEALANSVQIARRCSLLLQLGESRLPEYPVPAGETTEGHLRSESVRGLEMRLARLPDVDRTTYESRLDTELGVICSMGFAGYFLIVADFIRWARENGVPVGPGRGSGAGSLVAYSLGITDIDPLQYDLLFERFLNPERVSMPDFDVDFCMDGRDRVIDYVAEKYGRKRVSQIITYGTMAAKAVVRDVGRVLGFGYGYVDKIAKLVPFELDITLDAALEKEPELKKLYKDDEEVRGLIDLARSLEGLTRNAGKHAGGVVIAPSVIEDFAPLYCEAGGGSVVTQFDKDDVEAAGLVKFDFLGLRTLTVIDHAVRTINAAREAAGEGGPALDMSDLPMDDAATFALLKSCQTTAVFQLESRGMKDLVRRLQPLLWTLPGGMAFPFNPPAIPGLGSVGGFQLQLVDRAGLGTDRLYQAAQALIAESARHPDKVAGVATFFQKDVPQVWLDIDRAKLQRLGVTVADAFAALQLNFGSAYVNQFNRFNQVYQVFVQADSPNRMTPEDLDRIYVSGKDRRMVPFSAFATARTTTGPDNLTHYNVTDTIAINGTGAAGVSSGDATAFMEELCAQVLPQGVSYEWTGITYQERKSSNAAPVVFTLAIVAVFLFLAAQYESWTLPVLVVGAVPFAALGAVAGLRLVGKPLDVYAQIGLVMLIGLAAKNAILIVEFAKEASERGRSPVEAAMDAARLRLRPILMTAFSFILGVVPLVIATGAGANSRRSIGITVLAGLAVSTLLSLVIVPVFYALLVTLRDRTWGAVAFRE